jgi:ABC-type maltose transport system permease subunit
MNILLEELIGGLSMMSEKTAKKWAKIRSKGIIIYMLLCILTLLIGLIIIYIMSLFDNDELRFDIILGITMTYITGWIINWFLMEKSYKSFIEKMK